VCCFVFFFSSRRRHTRFSRDWSSDVCSSDLVVLQVLGITDYGLYAVVGGVVGMLSFINGALGVSSSRFLSFELGSGGKERLEKRSEERRVGKEGRCRWSRDVEKKKQ